MPGATQHYAVHAAGIVYVLQWVRIQQHQVEGRARVESVDTARRDGEDDTVEPLILARGEATGHHHSVVAASARLYHTATVGIMLLEVLRRVQLKHQEHAPITLPPGSYLVRRQREYISEGEQRWVAD